jgi:SAM-dependent methyltransferase
MTGRFEGVGRIVRFNWPMYAAGSAVAGSATAVALSPVPAGIRLAAGLGAMAAAWGTGSSLAVSHWVYDRSPVRDWRWLPSLLPEPPRRWANIHAGYDETTIPLRGLFPVGMSHAIDLFDPALMTEPSIRRARALHPRPDGTVAGRADHLPLETGGCDAVFLLFAAHELRRPRDREALFAETSRVLRPGGRLVLVEHVRDIANAIAFGPGVGHFLSRGEWFRVAERAGLGLETELRITPFVRCFTWSSPIGARP